ENISGLHRTIRFVRGPVALNDLRDHQHFFQFAELRRRRHPNVQEHVLARADFAHFADGQTFGENAIAAARHYRLTRLNLLIFHDVLDDQVPARRPRQDALQSRFLQGCAHATELVVNHQHLARGGKHAQHLAYNAVRRNHRHIGLHAVVRTLVQVEDPRLVAAARSNDLRRQRLRNELFFEIEDRLQPPCLKRILLQPHIMQPHLLDLLAQLSVFPAHAAQVKVIRPAAEDAVLPVHNQLLNRGHGGDRPEPHQAHAALRRTDPHLHRQPNDLSSQDSGQRNQVLVACQETFHRNRRRGGPRPIVYSIEILRRSLKSLSILPVPSTTLHSGSSAIETGSPVSSRMRLSRFFSSAPPPVSTIPRSLMSAESSGGVRSSTTRIAFIIVATHSPSHSRISLSSIVIVFGTPSIRLRPLISMVIGLSSGYAEPNSILICSAVRSPISRLYFRLR